MTLPVLRVLDLYKIDNGLTPSDKKNKRKESFYERAYRLKKELPWPYNSLIDFKNKKGG